MLVLDDRLSICAVARTQRPGERRRWRRLVLCESAYGRIRTSTSERLPSTERIELDVTRLEMGRIVHRHVRLRLALVLLVSWRRAIRTHRELGKVPRVATLEHVEFRIVHARIRSRVDVAISAA